MQYPTKDNSTTQNPSQQFYGTNKGSSIFQNSQPQQKAGLFQPSAPSFGINSYYKVENKSTTPEKTGLFINKQAWGLFPDSKQQSSFLFKPEIKPATSDQQINPFKTSSSGVNLMQVQNQVAQLLQLKKDSQLQKQMMEQMLKRIKQLEAKNTQLSTQKNEFLQKNIMYENMIKKFQQQYPQAVQQLQQAHQFQQPQQGNLSLNNSVQPQPLIKPIKSNPINFDYSKKDELFPSTFPSTIFNEDDIYPSAFTQKTFLASDGYAFQAYVAFNSFYAIKYIILQKVKNKHGYLDLTQSTAQRLTNQSKTKRSANWYLYHQNSSRNVVPHSITQQLAKDVVLQMKQGQNNPLNISIKFEKYISIQQSKCTIYHPDWTISTPFELQLYNCWNYNDVNNIEVKQILKKNISQWINQKNQQHLNKKNNHQLVMWFDQIKGNFHIIWH